MRTLGTQEGGALAHERATAPTGDEADRETDTTTEPGGTTDARAPVASRERFPYHPALDGLRALALIAIVAYHLQYTWADGAFLSVDLFFLLSGFLITTLLLIEWGNDGTIGLRRFWSRRARRLLPALLLTLVFVAVFTRLEVDPWMRTSVRNDGLASLTYVANWRFIASDQGYFQTFAAPSPLRHMWTLAIEEQFYLLWPLVSLAALRVGRGLRALVAVCVVGVVASVAVMAATYEEGDPLRAYYGTDARLQAILAGALLAIVLRVWRPGAMARRLIPAVGAVAFAVMMFGWATAHGTAPAYYHGGSVLHAAVACVVLTACLHAGPVRTVLGCGVMAWIGRLSYGLYLFHWPIIVWLVPNRVGLHGLALDALRIALTVVAAIASYYLVELPVRERRLPTVVVHARDRLRRPPRSDDAGPRRVAGGRLAPVLATPVLVVGALALTTASVVVSAGGATPPPEYLVGDREEGERLTAEAAGTGEEYEIGDPLPCFPNPEDSTREADAALDEQGAAAVPGAEGLRVLTVGDSIMCSIYPGMRAVGARSGAEVTTAAVIGCGVASGETTTTRGEQVTPNTHRCPGFVADAFDRAYADFEPDVVLWVSIWEKSDLVVDGRVLVSGTPEAEAEIQRRMDAALDRLTAGGARVLLAEVPAAAANDGQWGAETSNAIDDASYERLSDILHRFAARHPDEVTLVDLHPLLCPSGAPCPAEVDGVRKRPDGRHLSPATAAELSTWLLPQLVDLADTQPDAGT